LETHTQLAEQFISRDHCLLGRPELVWPAFFGDLLFGVAYLLIPLMLWYLTRKFVFSRPLKMVFLVYAGFIFLCGATHITDAILMFRATPTLVFLDVWLRCGGGIFSVFSAAVTLFAARRFLALMRQFNGVTVQMRKERKQFDRVSTETWDRFMDVQRQVDRHLAETGGA
jgi:hypothetical protein